MKYAIIFFVLVLSTSFTLEKTQKYEPYIHFLREGNTELSKIEPIITYHLDGKQLGLCNFNDLENLLREKAKSVEANIVTITNVYYPNAKNACYRLDASLYKINNLQKITKEVIWSPTKSLTWEDFKQISHHSSANNNAHSHATHTSAITHSGLLMNSKVFFSEDKLVPLVYAVFDCEKSWVLDQEKGDVLLNHEQRHFDIAEVFARKLRKEFQAKSFTIDEFDTHVRNLYEMYFDELNRTQDLYDKQTNHGLNILQQNKWDEWVDQELNKFNDYSI